MMFGMFGDGRKKLPRVLHVSIARYSRDLPKKGESLQFLVSIQEEGTGITWQQNMTVDPESENRFLEMIQDLYWWSKNAALTLKGANERVRELGSQLYETFIGPEGKKVLESIIPTAVLFDVDETILNLPWELIRAEGDVISQKIPFGRLVTSRVIPRPGLNPLKEDNIVRILLVANPTMDLAAGEREVIALKELEGVRGGFSIEVSVQMREKATRSAFSEILAACDYDILHFSGHGSFDPSEPEMSAIRFADGMLSAEDVLNLKWKAPPYLVFNSACESGRAADGKRLVSNESQSNGLAAAFIAAGASAYAGYFWPVTESGACLFTKAFYSSLFERENVGLSFLEARRYVATELGEVGDLTGYSAILFGDAASGHRRDLAMAE